MSESNMCEYLHFQSKPLMNLWIFATVHNLMKDINLIDSCQAHLPCAIRIEHQRTSDGGNGNHSVSLPIILIKI